MPTLHKRVIPLIKYYVQMHHRSQFPVLLNDLYRESLSVVQLGPLPTKQSYQTIPIMHAAYPHRPNDVRSTSARLPVRHAVVIDARVNDYFVWFIDEGKNRNVRVAGFERDVSKTFDGQRVKDIRAGVLGQAAAEVWQRIAHVVLHGEVDVLFRQHQAV